MRYEVMTTAEVDGPISGQPGFVVVEFTPDGGEGRVVSSVFEDEQAALAMRDLLSASSAKRIDQYVIELIGSDNITTRAQMLRILRGCDLTETEREIVITQVLEANAFQASFEHRQAVGYIDADMGGCAA